MADAHDRDIDPRTIELAAELERFAMQRFTSRKAWADAALMHPTQLSHYLNGKSGVSMRRFLDLLTAAGGVLLVEHAADLAPTGAINHMGVLVCAGGFQLPMTAVVEAPISAAFAAGDELTISPADIFEAGRWLLIQTDAGRELVHAQKSDGVDYIIRTNGDEVRFRPERHTVLGRVTSRRTTI